MSENTDRFERDLMRGSLELMVLSVLSDGPQYGYLIQKHVREVSDQMVRLQGGTLYPLLHRLEADGVIRARWEKDGERERKWYELTTSGRRRLTTRVAQWKRYVSCVTSLLPREPEVGLA